MKHKIISSLLCIALLSSLAVASPEEANEIYVCAEDEATGFNWINGKWIKASFKPETWVVKRIPSYKYETPEARRDYRTFLCAVDKSVPDVQDKNFKMTSGCYSIVKLGEAMTPATYSPCNEFYEKGKLEVVHCETPSNFSFSPKGQFIKKPWHADVSNTGNAGKKDSLVLSVGKCKQTKLD